MSEIEVPVGDVCAARCLWASIITRSGGDAAVPGVLTSNTHEPRAPLDLRVRGGLERVAFGEECFHKALGETETGRRPRRAEHQQETHLVLDQGVEALGENVLAAALAPSQEVVAVEDVA